MHNINLKIHEFDSSYQSAVINLWEKVFSKDPPWNDPGAIIKRKCEAKDDLFLVGTCAGEIIATVIGGYDGFRGWIYHLAVRPDLQRHGIGSKLTREIERRLINKGCIKINLQIRSHNVETISFYTKLGYNVENHVSMGKILNSY